MMPILAFALLPIMIVFTGATVYVAHMDSSLKIKLENAELLKDIKGNNKTNVKNK